MGNKLTGKALAKFEADRDVWREVLEGVKEIKAGGGRRTKELRPAQCEWMER
jgi:putative transcriptional regulator